jgi:Domain of unknown function (DUF4177)
MVDVGDTVEGTLQRMEYRVIELLEKRIGGALSGHRLEEILNDEARKGWMLKSILCGRQGAGWTGGRRGSDHHLRASDGLILDGQPRRLVVAQLPISSHGGADLLAARLDGPADSGGLPSTLNWASYPRPAQLLRGYEF